MKEKQAWSINGFLGILLFIIGGGLGVLLLTQERILPGIILIILGVIFVSTITAVQPNEASVVTFFGSYLGTIRKSGLWLIVPFSNRKKFPCGFAILTASS